MIEHNGKKYARVSDILSPFNNFGHIDPDVLANKARLGTNVHTAIADDISGELPLPGPNAVGYFKSYEKWRDAVHPTFLQSEQRYFDDEKMITGQIDALVSFSEIDIRPVLIDFKTSAQESKIVWPMQAHLYAYLLEKNGITANPRFLFIKLDKRGELPTVFQYRWDPNTYVQCMDAVNEFWLKDIK